jgi:hypothetical protein
LQLEVCALRRLDRNSTPVGHSALRDELKFAAMTAYRRAKSRLRGVRV